MVWAVAIMSLLALALPLMSLPASALTEYRYEPVASAPTPLDYKGVAWAVNGREAMVVGGVQALIRYEPDDIIARSVGGNWSTYSQTLEEVAYDPDGTAYVVSGRLDATTIRGDLWHVVGDSVTLLASIQGDILEAVSVSRSGRVLAIGALGSLFEYIDGDLVSLGSVGDVVLYDLAWAPDGSGALLVGAAGSITWFDAATGDLEPVEFTSTHPLHAVSWRPGTKEAWAVGEGTLVVEVNATSLGATRVRPYQPRTETLHGVSWHPGGEVALVVGEAGATYLYRMGVFTQQLISGDEHLLDVMWNPAGDEALVVGAAGTLLHYAPRIEPQNRAPNAVISSPADGVEIEEGKTITFDGSDSSDPDGDRLSYQWESNSTGLMGEEPVVRKKLPVGTHRVTLHVDDGQGHNSTDSVTVVVTEPVPPERRLYLSITFPLPSSLVKDEIIIAGTASYDLGQIASVEVAVDGEGWRAAEGTETWSMAWDTTQVEDGIHTVLVRVIADDGTSKMDNVLVEVRNAVVPNPPEVPNVTIRLTDRGQVDELMEFSAEAEDLSPWILVWSFGDGSNGQGSIVRHAYTEPGTYEVTLELYMEGSEAPSAAFVATVIIESAEREGLSLEAILVIALVATGVIYLAGFYGGRRALGRD